ncbi:TPA: hypothetical protein ACGUTS_004629 [Vibrio vulnificus]
MKATITYKRFFAFSESSNKFFNTSFGDGMNLVHGKNTSGKSTLFQSILYTFGINDEKQKLEEILADNVIFRLDIQIERNGKKEDITFVRDNETLVVKQQGQPIVKYIGIGGNSSREHIKLKKHLGELFGFTLNLESSGEYKQAPLEAMFLPYYIAQDVGWVYRHKSFRGLDFIKNFKSDFFDYYLGIKNDFDRVEKNRLLKEKISIESDIKFLSNIEKRNDDVSISKLNDEFYITKSIDYIESYKINKSALITLEKEYLEQCNKLSLMEQRKLILQKVKRALKKQIPVDGNCSNCNQPMPWEVEEIYNFQQDFNDTEEQLKSIKQQISNLKKSKGIINSLEDKINEAKDLVAKDFNKLLKYNVENISYESWLKNKVNIRLQEDVEIELGRKVRKLADILNSLSGFKTDDDIQRDRNNFDYKFKTLFEQNLDSLGVKIFDNDRFLLLYKIPAFPRQGVELLKTLISYCFAFNSIIKDTNYVHRFPFMLDAIFEGDLDDESRQKIIKFVCNNKPSDTQIIFSIADSTKNKVSAEEYNKLFLDGSAHLICIGDNSKERAFLSPYNQQHDDYLENTLAIIEG